MNDLSFTTELETNPNAGVSGYDNSPLPPGDYSFVVEKAECVPYVAGVYSLKPEDVAQYLHDHTDVVAGECIKIQAKITDGPFTGRKLFWGRFEFAYRAASDETTKEGVSNGRAWKITPEGGAKAAQENFNGLLRRIEKGSIQEISEIIGCTGVVSVSIKKDRNKFHFTVRAAGKQPKAQVTGTIAHASSAEAPF